MNALTQPEVNHCARRLSVRFEALPEQWLGPSVPL
jgi:hypothetical protein